MWSFSGNPFDSRVGTFFSSSLSFRLQRRKNKNDDAYRFPISYTVPSHFVILFLSLSRGINFIRSADRRTRVPHVHRAALIPV